MRFSLNSITPSCSWPYQSNELLLSFSWKGDMAEKEHSVVPYEAQNGSTKSPNVSTDSGFEGEKLSLKQDLLPSEEATCTLGQWTKPEPCCHCLESQQSSCPCSPLSPQKHLDDSDFHESPLEKRPVGSLSVDSDSVFPVEESEICVGDNFLHCSSEGQYFSDHGGNHHEVLIMQKHQANCRPENNVYHTCCTSEPQDLMFDSPKDIELQDNLHVYQSSEACLAEAEQSCDETYSDDALSTYYVPSSVSMATEDVYSQPPVRPPRASRPGQLRREETRSEADACEPSNKCLGTPYKSLRSQSDPSTHYTTVVKPTAIRPDPVSVDCTEYRSSLESLHLGQISAALVRYQNRRSAFREHLRSTLSQSEGVNILFSRSLETPPHVESPRLNNGAIGRGTPHSSPIQLTPTRACSLNDVTTDSHFQCLVKMASSSSSLQAELCPTHSSGSAKSNGCIIGVSGSKRYSMPSNLNGARIKNGTVMKQEPIHMTLEEVRNSLQALNISPEGTPTDEKKSPCRQFIRAYLRSRKSKREIDGHCSRRKSQSLEKVGHRRSFPSSVKAAFSNWFGFKRSSVKSEDLSKETDKSTVDDEVKADSANTSPFMNRALPPLPIDEANLWGPTVRVDEETSSLSAGSDSFSENDNNHNRMRKMDYAASIEKVKDCGWYWGPISGETAEKLLVNEPDGSFVLRDSSDEHYIFSLTFKLNGLVRHVRIEHDHGNFSFGCLQKFRSNTIVDFIENAVEHSRSGRYLFFLHRRPILGPMRVQLLHPVSRFKQVQSLQHLCRFIILKTVRRDLIANLPLPRRLKDYLNTPHYYSEELAHLPVPTVTQQQQSVSSQPNNLVPPLPPPDLES